MCAIAGTVNCEGLSLDAMQHALYHRGPDDQSRYTHKNCTLIHNRLAIQDVEGGVQPMHFGHYTLVYNGEIYNHRAIRKERLADVRFTTHSDTETLLHLLIREGIQGLEAVDGMFAIALLDREAGSLTLVRDRMGKKPLYYLKQGERFVFASEIRGIGAVIPLEKDDRAVGDYLRSGYFYGEGTAYRHLFSLEPGTALTLDLESGTQYKSRYFDPFAAHRVSSGLSEVDALSEADAILHRSVKDRLLSSDLEVGAFLSGGIDSGLVVGAASHYTERLKTFTVSFDGAYDEAPLAQEVAKRYGTDHTVIDIRMDVKNDLEKILGNYSQPFFDSSALPSYYVSKAARKHVTVILNGDGADEFFGGYRRYVPVANGWVERAKSWQFIKPFLPLPRDKKHLYSYLYRLLELGAKTNPLDFYLAASTDIFEGFETLLDGGENAAMQEQLCRIAEAGLSPLGALMLADQTCLLPSNLLVKMDIATMANSLEGRSPFLSRDFIRFAPSLPDTLKIQGRQTKYLLRRLAERYLPESLIHQPKRGFEIPLRNWIENDLDEMVRDYVRPGSFAERYLRKGALDAIINRKAGISPEKRAKMLWALLSVEIWARR